MAYKEASRQGFVSSEHRRYYNSYARPQLTASSLMRIGFSFEVKHQPITVRAHKPGDKTKAGNFRKIRNGRYSRSSRRPMLTISLDSTLFCAVEATPQWPRDFARKYCTAPIALSEHFCVVSLWRIDNGHFLQAQNELQGNVSVSMMRNPAPKNQGMVCSLGC